MCVTLNTIVESKHISYLIFKIYILWFDTAFTTLLGFSCAGDSCGSARLAQTYQAKRGIQNFDDEGLSEDLKLRVGFECELTAIVSQNSGEQNRAPEVEAP